MNELAKTLGELAARTIVEAIRQGKSRKDAIDAAAEALKRSDVVSDTLWGDLDRYIVDVSDFEENGSG